MNDKAGQAHQRLRARGGVGRRGVGRSARLKKKSHSVAVAPRGLSGVVDLGGLLEGRWRGLSWVKRERPPELAVLGGEGRARARGVSGCLRARARARAGKPLVAERLGGSVGRHNRGGASPVGRRRPPTPPGGPSEQCSRTGVMAEYPTLVDDYNSGQQLPNSERPGIQSNLNMDEPATSGSLGERHATQEGHSPI